MAKTKRRKPQGHPARIAAQRTPRPSARASEHFREAIEPQVRVLRDLGLVEYTTGPGPDDVEIRLTPLGMDRERALAVIESMDHDESVRALAQELMRP